MRVFVAGASGAIGRPLIAELIRQGHHVTGMARSDGGAQRLVEMGAAVAQVSAFDEHALREALRRSEAEVVIDELTALPNNPADFPAAFPGDRKLRLEGGGNLHRLARASGIRRYIQQASGFFLEPKTGLATESDPLAIDASPGIAASAQMYAAIESRLFAEDGMEGIALRYGFFYGPNTWYCPEGATGEQVRRQQFPMVGDGRAVWSFIHIEDAAIATVAALTAPAGIYNIVDSDPLPVSTWLPAFAGWLGAPPPLRISEDDARNAAGEDAVYYGLKLSGASNSKAQKWLSFKPRRLQWLASAGTAERLPLPHFSTQASENARGEVGEMRAPDSRGEGAE